MPCDRPLHEKADGVDGRSSGGPCHPRLAGIGRRRRSHRWVHEGGPRRARRGYEPKIAAAERGAKRAAEVARRNALLIEEQTSNAPANLSDEELTAAASRLPFAKEEVERLTPEQLKEHVRWAVQTDNRPAMYAYLSVIDPNTADSRLASFLRQANAKLRDKGPDGISKKAVAARSQAGRLQSLAEGRQRQAAAEEFRKRHGLAVREPS